MRCGVGFAALAAVLLLAPAAAKAARFTFFCSAPLAHSSQLMQRQAGPNYRVRGRIGVVQLERIPDPSLPVRMEGNNIPHMTRMADVMIMNSDTYTAVTLGVVPRYPGNETESVADVYVQTIIDGVDSDHVIATMRSRGYMWEDLPFEIEVREDRVIVEAGGRREEFAVTIGRDANIHFSCVGGSFSFEDVDWDG